MTTQERKQPLSSGQVRSGQSVVAHTYYRYRFLCPGQETKKGGGGGRSKGGGNTCTGGYKGVRTVRPKLK